MVIVAVTVLAMVNGCSIDIRGERRISYAKSGGGLFGVGRARGGGGGGES